MKKDLAFAKCWSIDPNVTQESALNAIIVISSGLTLINSSYIITAAFAQWTNAISSSNSTALKNNELFVLVYTISDGLFLRQQVLLRVVD